MDFFFVVACSHSQIRMSSPFIYLHAAVAVASANLTSTDMRVK